MTHAPKGMDNAPNCVQRIKALRSGRCEGFIQMNGTQTDCSPQKLAERKSVSLDKWNSENSSNHYFRAKCDGLVGSDQTALQPLKKGRGIAWKM